MYISRTLDITNADDNQSKKISDLDLLAEVLSSPIVILAEAGMGKTLMMEKLAEQQTDTKFLTASDLINKSLQRLRLTKDDILLIDAFDEMPSNKDGAGINNVLNKLAEIGTQSFIITCRSIEWDSSNHTEIIVDYQKVRSATLHSLTYDESHNFLQDNGFPIDTVTNLLDSLDRNNLSSFYENPRNLSLLSEIDYSSTDIPTNKAELFELATSKLWQEPNAKAQNALSNFTENRVLDCAGFIFTCYLLTGKQRIFTGNTANTPDDAIHIFSLGNIFDRELLQATIKSRLFHSIDENFVKPWHRSIAEYLGAMWLAKQMTYNRIRRRILPYLIVDGGVISSLRGMFAWLPKFNVQLSNTVIQADPYGLIEYADTSYLSDTDSKLLFYSLQKMADSNPFFRQHNFLKQAKSEALARYSLLENIRSVLKSEQRNFHLLTTILEVLQDASFVNELSDELFNISYDVNRYYSERYDAFMLLKSKGLIQSSDFDVLIEQGSEDSLRLCFEYADKHGYELLTDEQVILLIMKSYDFKKEDYEIKTVTPRNGSYFFFSNYPIDRIETLLKNIRKEVIALKIDRFDYSHNAIQDINKLIFSLIQRYLEESDKPIDSLVFYQSLSIFYTLESFGYNNKSTTEFFTNYFSNNPTEKISIQEHFIDLSDEDFRFYKFNRSVFQSLFPTIEDTKKLIPYIQNQRMTKKTVKQWERFISLFGGKDGIPDEIYQLAKPYTKRSKNRLPFLEKQREKVIPDWKIENEKSKTQRELEIKTRLKNDRKLYSKNIQLLENGNYQFCSTPAEVLLGRYRTNVQNLSPYGKLEDYLGKDLTISAITGFKNSLYSTIPTLHELLTNYYNQKMLKIENVLIAGIYCKLYENQSLSDLNDDVILLCSIIMDIRVPFAFFNENHGILKLNIKEALKLEIIKRGLKHTIIEQMFIPQFNKNVNSIKGVDWVYGENSDEFSINTIVNLLNTYPTMDKYVQNQLVDTLLLNNQLDKVKDLIINNADFATTSNINDFDRWLSFLSVIDESLFFKNIPCVTYPTSLFWQLNETYHETRWSKVPKMSLKLMSWIAYRFSYIFPNTSRPSGVGSGNRNMWQASEFILFCLSQISNITTKEAHHELKKLQGCVHISYRMQITNYLAEQTNKIREENYQALKLNDLLNIIQDTPPTNCKDLKTLTIELLNDLQKKIDGNETDSYKVFFKDLEKYIPQDENYCRDRLADLLNPYIERYGFSLDTEADMPNDKRADLVCKNSQMQLPIEVKGQWHKELWTAMNDQLGGLYLKEYQSQDQGIYLIFYFGDITNKKLTKYKSNKFSPKSSKELQANLTSCIDEQYKNGIEVFVMDLSSIS